MNTEKKECLKPAKKYLKMNEAQKRKTLILHRRIWVLNQYSIQDPDIDEIQRKLTCYREQIEKVKADPNFEIFIYKKGTHGSRPVSAKCKKTGEKIGTFESIKQASELTKVSKQSIWNTLNGKYKCRKYEWKYENRVNLL